MHIFIRTSYFIYRFSFFTLCHAQWERIGRHVVPVRLLLCCVDFVTLLLCFFFAFFLLSIWRHSMASEFPFKANHMTPLNAISVDRSQYSCISPINTHNDVQFKLISTLKIEFPSMDSWTVGV